MKNKNGVFIGARALSDVQVKLIVPTYDNIINQIEEIRGQAKLINRKRDNSSKKQYNNTIGLFGERGTGKTSTMYTILNSLEAEGNKDIVLPIIEPDIYGDSTKILGAILGVLKKEMQALENEIEKNEIDNKEFSDFFNQCRFKESNELSRSYNEVLEYYCYKDAEYRNLIMKNYSDMETYKEKYSYILAPDYEFNNKLHSFVEELISVKRNLNKGEEPLIIITIDDIDLKTNKCRELIDAVMAYTCHPNIICFLSGDYEILSESITLALLENEKLATTSLVENNELFDSKHNLISRKKYLAHEYLKKVLPPAFRHNVIKWNFKSIPNFSFQVDKSGNETIYLHKKLDDLMGEDNIFKRKNKKSDEIFSEIPYVIFDKTPRGLINVFYYLSKYDKEEFVDDEKRFVFIKSLIDTIIYSSSDLIKDQSKIYEKHIKWGSNEENTIIDFKRLFTKKLSNSFKNELNSDKDKGKKDDKEDNNKEEKRKYINRYITFFILLQTTKELLPKANVVGYEEAKKYFFYLYKFNIGENILNVDVDKVNFNNEKFKDFMKDKNPIINDWIDQIIFNTDFKFALFFMEKLKNIIKIDDEKVKDLSVKEKRQIYLILCNLILDYDNGDMIKNWYLDREKYKHIIEFLDSVSREPIENEKIEKILNQYSFLKGKDYEMNIEYTENQIQLLQNPEKKDEKNNKAYKVYENYKKQLFYNYINKEKYKNNIIVVNNDQDLKNLDNESKSIIKILKKLDNNQNVKNNKTKIDELLRDEVHKKIDVVVGMINIIDINDENFKEEFRKFYNVEYNSKTVYRKTHEFIKSIIVEDGSEKEKVSIGDYIKIVEKLRYLGYKSTAWYGVIEARNLLETLQKEAYLDIEEPVFNFIIQEYIKYRNVNSAETEMIINLEQKKNSMKKALEEAFKKAKAEEELFYKEFDLELPEEEDNADANEY
ncbi:hypothetical protein SAMN02745163_01315 [Clostridium cavendishii DSM 21758]|uniref:Uncharacterized protein n=1 Tax=Clostridium cavendishii DSM 21758 TaxID=1121302 RepID=A0A1M6GKQ2_9CLOT|nr:hypothetical protein [Clostridium cavendishii]SHJ10508.1 hypothetical protein SAMN02745163_01315 [Clostridium cavendishii DSM 21758]